MSNNEVMTDDEKLAQGRNESLIAWEAWLDDLQGIHMIRRTARPWRVRPRIKKENKNDRYSFVTVWSEFLKLTLFNIQYNA
jgi:hypothetical protein